MIDSPVLAQAGVAYKVHGDGLAEDGQVRFAGQAGGEAHHLGTAII